MKKILIILIISVIFSIFLSAGAENIKWQTALENLLVKFPTILDENALREAGSGITRPTDAEGIYVPCYYKFQDLDGDNIPEAIITFAHPESEWVYDNIYKMYGNSYEKISQDEKIVKVMFMFYKNTEGRLVAATQSGYTVNAIYFADIRDKKLILSDFIDSNGNDNYNGVKYSGFLELDRTSLESATDADQTLQPLPEIDCSNIVNAARYKVYGSPKTGDNNLPAVFTVLIFFINVFYIMFAKKRRKNQCQLKNILWR